MKEVKGYESEREKKEGRDGQMNAGEKERAKRGKLCGALVGFPHYNMVCMYA